VTVHIQNFSFFWKFVTRGRGVRKIVFFAWRNLRTTPKTSDMYRASRNFLSNQLNFFLYGRENLGGLGFFSLKIPSKLKSFSKGEPPWIRPWMYISIEFPAISQLHQRISFMNTKSNDKFTSSFSKFPQKILNNNRSNKRKFLIDEKLCIGKKDEENIKSTRNHKKRGKKGKLWRNNLMNVLS